MKAILLVALVALASTAVAAPTQPRFDEQVRQDFFDGIRGDDAALARARKLCDDTLAANPSYPEAMVWHGAIVMWDSALKFRASDRAAGIALYQQGLGEMDHAVELAPNDIGVRIPRGAVLLAMAPFTPEPEKAKLLQRGVADYETTLAVQSQYFAKLSLHSREQLLYGLTDAYAALGDQAKARALYTRMTRDAAGSELLPRAKTRAEGGSVTGPTPCQQCHAR
jgi:hypothetical protein